jgi:hypothetical protein
MKGKKNLLVLAAALVLITGGCNNFFHDLIPPDGDRIESFTVLGQAAIDDNRITVLVPPGTNLGSKQGRPRQPRNPPGFTHRGPGRRGVFPAPVYEYWFWQL